MTIYAQYIKQTSDTNGNLQTPSRYQFWELLFQQHSMIVGIPGISNVKTNIQALEGSKY